LELFENDLYAISCNQLKNIRQSEVRSYVWQLLFFATKMINCYSLTNLSYFR
jgi:hypothetical protein